MFNSFHGTVLKGYKDWVVSKFRTPVVPDNVRDYLLHLSTPSANPKHLTLWPHQRESVLRAIYANEILKPQDAGWKDVLLNVVTGGGKTTITAALMAYLRVCHEEETDVSPEERKEELKVAMTIGTDADENRYSAVVSRRRRAFRLKRGGKKSVNSSLI
jgi:hypothetical protein